MCSYLILHSVLYWNVMLSKGKREPPISHFDSKWFFFLSQRCKRKLKINYGGYKIEQQISIEKLVHSLQQGSYLLTANVRYADLGWWFMAKFATPLSLWTGLNDYFWNSQIFWRWIVKLRLLWTCLYSSILAWILIDVFCL